jgi:hypothetical protein
MRIVDPETGRSYDEKRRVRYNEPGQPRELTFSCYHRYAFLSRDRTREWFCEALAEARTKSFFQLWAYVVMPVIDSFMPTRCVAGWWPERRVGNGPAPAGTRDCGR